MNPRPARLVHEISFGNFGADIMKSADLDGDGKLEMLLLQNGGQYAVARGSSDDKFATEADRRLHCLTAVRMDGTVMWQDGKPWSNPDDPFLTHGGDMLVADDIDYDGRTEVIFVDHDQLRIAEGATGKIRRSVRLPADNFMRLATAQFGDPARGKQIICKVNDLAYPPWEYGNPTIIYNADLSIHRDQHAVRGGGHNMVVMDIDGDGRDELFNGYCLFDDDMTMLYQLDLGLGFDYAHDHADNIRVVDINGDGKLEVCYAGTEDYFVTDLAGRILWRTHAAHSQNSLIGPWGPHGEMRIIMGEKNRGLWGMDAAGKILWRRTDLNGYARHSINWQRGPRANWAVFRPQLRPVLAREPGPIQCIVISELPRLSDPAWSRGLWPSFMDGDGRLIEVFPWDDSYAHPVRNVRCARSYDGGLIYMTAACDLDGDGLDEMIIHTRDRAWVFHSEG